MIKNLFLASTVLAGVLFAVASPASAIPMAPVDGASTLPIEHVWWHHHYWHRHYWHRHYWHRHWHHW